MKSTLTIKPKTVNLDTSASILMKHQMAREGAQCLNVMIRVGPHLRNRKITWANIVYAVLDVGVKHMTKLPI